MMQVSLSSFSPGYESVYDLIYRIVPKNGGIDKGVLWSRFYREYLSDHHTTPPAAIPLLTAKKRPIPIPFDTYLSHLCVSDILTFRDGRLYRVRYDKRPPGSPVPAVRSC